MKIINFLLVVLGFYSTSVLAKPLSVEDFIAAPDFYDAEFSPNGRYLADIVQIGKLRMVNIRDMEKEGNPIIGQIGDSVMRPYLLMWANNERLIVYLTVPVDTNEVRRKVNKDDQYDIDENFMYRRVVSVNLQGKDAVSPLTETQGMKKQVNLSRIRNFLPKDAENVLMTAEHHEKEALYKVNVYTGASEMVALGGAETIFFVCDENGKPLYRVDYDYIAELMTLFELKNKDWIEFDNVAFDTEDTAVHPEDLIGINTRGNVLYRKLNEKTGYHEILERDRETRLLKTLVSFPDKDVMSLILHNDEVVGYEIEDNDVMVSRYFDKEKQSLYDKIYSKMGGYTFDVDLFDEEQKHFSVRSGGPDFPGGIYFYDRNKDVLSHYDDYKSRLSADDLAAPARSTFVSRDGVKIRMYLLLPPDYEQGKKYPLVIMPHGGPQVRDYFLYDEFAQFIATRGYVVAKPNFRGSTGYGQAFESAGYKQWGGIMQDDLQDAAKFLIQKGFADPQEICVVGGSYGGYAALMALVKHGDFYKCAVSLNGVTDLTALIKYQVEVYKNYQRIVDRVYKTTGHPSKDKDYLKANSPLQNADKIIKPVLLVAGTSDWVVRYYQSRNMAKKLKKLDRPVEYMEVKDAPHAIFSDRKDKKNVYIKVAEFLEKNLKKK
jgi:dipeptidyl aminopeptidase/acylaminoacyl peptidase